MPFNWLKTKNTSGYPDFWRAYLESFSRRPSLDTSISELRFVVFDTETTGLDLKHDQILSIGAVSLKGKSLLVADHLELYLHQVYQPLRSAVEVHGILPVDREGSMEEKEAIGRFLNFAGSSVLVGHHVAFDVAMINGVLKETVGQKLRNQVLDTAALARRLMPPDAVLRSGELGLDALCRRYGIPLNDRHTAAGDAFLTAILFLKLTARLEKRGVRTLRDLLRKP